MPAMSEAEVARLKADAEARGCEIWIDTTASQAYVTEVSVPSFGDGGIQRLHCDMKEPEPDMEAQL